MSEPGLDPWLVLRTRSRHENVVEEVLRQKRIVAFLPKRKVVRSWRGHNRSLEMPLFPGYLFVQPRADQYEGLRYIRGSCGLVMAVESKPAILPDKDLKAVRMLVDGDARFTVDLPLMVGKRVKIVCGPLMGVEGELVRVKNQDMLIINVDIVGSSVRVEVDRDAVEAV